MEAKLLEATMRAVSSAESLSSSRLDKTFTSQRTLILARKPFQLNLSAKGYGALRVSSSPIRCTRKKRVDESESLTVKSVRHSLTRQEDSLIFSLLERAQYCYNADAYDHDSFSLDGFHGSLVEFMLRESEKLHAQVGRYESPDEHPFFPANLPKPVLPHLQYQEVLHRCATLININSKIWNMYFRDLLPRLAKPGDDGNSGSAAFCDTICLQALSKRIHFGKFVAEAKFRESPASYESAIIEQDRARLMEMLTFEEVEVIVKKRVEKKTKTFGQEVGINQEEDTAQAVYKIRPSIVANLYADWIMPLTKEVQVQYLLRRLD
ncbi:Chorismate mutase [Bertholletia excelsa]